MDTWIDYTNIALTIPYNTKQREVTNYHVAQILCVRSGGSPFWSPSQLARLTRPWITPLVSVRSHLQQPSHRHGH